jgi:hypothetical protein
MGLVFEGTEIPEPVSKPRQRGGSRLLVDGRAVADRRGRSLANPGSRSARERLRSLAFDFFNRDGVPVSTWWSGTGFTDAR